MQPRAAISNGFIAIVVLFFALMINMVLKARYRLGVSEPSVQVAQETPVPKAIPVAQVIEPEIHQPRAFQQGEWWVLPNPEVVVSRANEGDTLRIRSGKKEDVFVLYFVDAVETNATRPKRLRDQFLYYQASSQDRLLDLGREARHFATDLLRKHPFTVYTKWGRVPNTERFYAFIRVEIEPGKFQDLGKLLVQRGYAAPLGQQTGSLPEYMNQVQSYQGELAKVLQIAKDSQIGAWALANPINPSYGYNESLRYRSFSTL